MDHPIINILGDPSPFLDRVFDNLDKDGIGFDNWYMDHICYRTATVEEYLDLKAQVLPYSTVLSDSVIGGREILVVELKNDFLYKNRKVSVLEIPMAKYGRPYPSGYEHIELVIDQSFDNLMKVHPNLEWDTKDICKATNPDLRLFYGDISVKFHHHPLKYIIEEEG